MDYWSIIQSSLQLLIIIMSRNDLSLLVIVLATCLYVSQQQQLIQINHISFSQNHIFFLSKGGHLFGFIERHSGEIMTKYQLQAHETIISVHKASDSVVLRSSRNKAILFDIASFHQEEIIVQIAFQHQQIIDVLRMNGKYYVLTDKDVRIYDRGEERKEESLKNVLSSARKNEFFKKMFLREGETIDHMIIVLIKNGSICIRSFQKVKKGTDECYFKVPYEITSIDRINNNILIQTQAVNYVICPETSSTYSFEGMVTQINDQFIQLAEFQTYDTKNQVFLQGIVVEGSKTAEMFWIRAVEVNKMAIFYNSILITQQKVDVLPRRAWVSPGKEKDQYDLLLEFKDNRFEMYQVQLKGSSNSFTLKWTNKSLQPSRRAQEL